MADYKVLIEPENGGRILGARRKKGDVFSASPSAVVFLLAEGIIGPVVGTEAAIADAAANSSPVKGGAKTGAGK